MNLIVEYNPITELFRNAAAEGRNSLFEYEVYTLLSLSGAETPPKCSFIPKSEKPAEESVMAIPGEKAVLKIVSPTIVHKTEVGGVRIVPKTPDKVRSAIRRILCEVPEHYADWIERHPDASPEVYKNFTGVPLRNAISKDLKGVLQVQFMPPDSESFGNELIVGLRHSREFGMVISAGLGGTDTELYASRFRKGQAVVASLCELSDGFSFFNLFKNTVCYRKLAGLTRGQRRIVTDDQLIECFESFIRLGNYYSPCNPDAPFIIEELEINPFTFTDYLMVPLDGMCRFSVPQPSQLTRPIEKIDNILHPKTIGIIGVSAKRRNFGRTILENILSSGFKKENIVIVRDGNPDSSGVRTVSSVAEFTPPVDLFIVAIGAEQVPPLVDDIIKYKAAAGVMLIPGGMGETEESKEMTEKMIANIIEAHKSDDGGPVFIGANCMGIISRPGSYDTWFIPREKSLLTTPSSYCRTAIFSQSGAFLLHRISQTPEMNPAYLISLGNQTDITLGDMMQYFANSDQADVIAIYAEGFKDLDGLAFTKAVKKARENGKQVVFYKAGRTPEGKRATSGHTASLAGNYMVCESAIQQAGAVIARNFTEFQDLILLSDALKNTVIRGKRLGIVSGGGFEAVGMADSIHSDEFNMELGKFSEPTREKIKQILVENHLQHLVTVANPLDINPSANDEVHAAMAEFVLADDNIDALVIGLDPLSPVTHSLDGSQNPAFDMNQPGSILDLLSKIKQNTDKPVVAVVDGGTQFAPMREKIRQLGIPVFTVCDRAISTLSLYMETRLRMD